MKKVKEQQQQKYNTPLDEENEEPTEDDDKSTEPKLLMVKVPYAEERGETIIKDDLICGSSRRAKLYLYQNLWKYPKRQPWFHYAFQMLLK